LYQLNIEQQEEQEEQQEEQQVMCDVVEDNVDGFNQRGVFVIIC